MTTTEDAAVRFSEQLVESDQSEAPNSASETSRSVSASEAEITQNSKFVTLDDYVRDMPAKVRLVVYNKVADAVRSGEISGLIHATHRV